MEAVAPQIRIEKTLPGTRNGWFSYRWTQIFEKSDIPAETSVLKAYRKGAIGSSTVRSGTH
ncbi:MAG: hypothetical protein CM1200mP36_10920 [Gammaproteobacteria bacterium]|nr:MAG: hypothetical protein CM1200mP36_10920 [Gammaproteobacteria bacterium]